MVGISKLLASLATQWLLKAAYNDIHGYFTKGGGGGVI